VLYIALIATPELVRVHHTPQKPHVLTQEAEDAIKLETLYMLTQGSNRDIKVQAEKIIARRTSTGETYQLLLRALESEDDEQRSKALKALYFLVQSPFEFRLRDVPTMHALVGAMQYFVKNPSPITTASETRAIKTLSVLIQYNTEAAIEAGVIEKWLGQVKWGDTPQEAREQLNKYWQWTPRDNDMYLILSALNRSPEGQKQLAMYGILELDPDRNAYYDGDDAFETEIEEALDSLGLETSTVRRRTPTATEDERNIRRWRRNAMVISDGTEPIGQNDIIQRRNTQTLG
jgi:hypothetical protein